MCEHLTCHWCRCHAHTTKAEDNERSWWQTSEDSSKDCCSWLHNIRYVSPTRWEWRRSWYHWEGQQWCWGVTKEILKKWLTSGATPRTYQHLIDCLRQSELGALVELIEQGMLYRYESEYTQHHVNYYDQTQFTTVHQGFNRHTKTSQSQLERIEMKTLCLHALEINTNAL